MKVPGGGLFSRLIPRHGGRLWIGPWAWSQVRFLSFFLPAAILLIVLVIYPIVATLTLSFLAPDGSYAGLHNYESVIGSPDTFNPACLERGPPCGTLLNNLIWIGIHLPLTVFMGLFLALLLQNVRGASFVKSLIFLGMVTPLIVVGVVLRFILEAPIGLVPAFFGQLGIEYLDRDFAIERLIDGFVDRPHATAPNLRDDAILADRPANHPTPVTAWPLGE